MRLPKAFVRLLSPHRHLQTGSATVLMTPAFNMGRDAAGAGDFCGNRGHLPIFITVLVRMDPKIHWTFPDQINGDALLHDQILELGGREKCLTMDSMIKLVAVYFLLLRLYSGNSKHSHAYHKEIW